MPAPAIPSVDQLRVLITVVDEGSFTAAAKRLGRTTSAISYSIDTLEAQLGISLFDRGTTRKPKVTGHGEAMVSEARAVVRSVEAMRARVWGLVGGLEPELSLVVDSMLPADRLAALLRDFHGQFPTVPVRLMVQPLGGVERMVRNGHARIGVGSHLHMDTTGFCCIDVTGVRMIVSLRRGPPFGFDEDGRGFGDRHRSGGRKCPEVQLWAQVRGSVVGTVRGRRR